MYDEILFSIIIPVYNVEKYLDECLNSIIPQVEERKDTEILLINDGSTDTSKNICESYLNLYPNLIKVFNNENQGLFLTRRFGYKQALGKYIINCDSDDTLEPHFIKKLLPIILDNNADVILYNMNLLDNNTKSILYNNVFTHGMLSKVTKSELYKCYFTSSHVISMCGKIFKKECLNLDLDYSAFYKKNFGEDSLQSAEIYSNATYIFYYNDELYNYRSDTGMTKKFNTNYYLEFKQVNNYLKKIDEITKIQDFNYLFSVKLFTIVGRAITQSRYDQTMSYKSRRNYLISIRYDEEVCKYESYYDNISPHLKRNYKLVDNLLLKNHYFIIHLFLCIKNILSKN